MASALPLIFISHITHEAKIALLLKDYLERSFPGGVEVFASSDYSSIQTGTPPFRAIIASLTRAAVFIVLLSEGALERRWINFESGFAYSRMHSGYDPNLKILPLAIRSQDLNVGGPLSELQVRRLHDDQTLKILLHDIGAHLNLRHKRTGRTIFLRTLGDVEQDLQNQDVRIKPVLTPDSQGRWNLIFDLVSPSQQPRRIKRIWAAVPDFIVDRTNDQRSEPDVKKSKERHGNEMYLTKELRPQISSGRGLPLRGTELPLYFGREISPRELAAPRFLLHDWAQERFQDRVVLHSAEADGQSSTVIRTLLLDIYQDFER